MLFPKPQHTPAGFWKQLSEAYFQAPRFGVSAVEWRVFLTGLLPLSDRLLEYAPTQLPPAFTITNQPTLQTIKAASPNNYYPNDADILYPLDKTDSLNPEPTKERVYLQSNLPYATEDRLADVDDRPVDFTQSTNFIRLHGDGKPYPCAQVCLQTLPAGTICYIHHYTWGVAKANTNARIRSNLIQISPTLLC